ncbi:CidA/LrgA family protein [Paenibacillus oceani]|uniref:CidA/LrgA family holin-like protein n=1 Tax=Paenibacillus oceani TaxID=2772510 RepID=A0A927CBV5_9BACL|nr:CidA/LrgA family holin-like protein [Paenibacillus oceani]MBD2864594.1 CidA/LrgA family holin-like protein [Paenibacillus oceani]
MRKMAGIALQILFFVGIAQIADVLASILPIPVPGSIVGIVLLFVLLKLKIVRLGWIEQGSNWLIAQMLLFFIPATVGIMNYKSMFMTSGLRIIGTIAISTAAVMICSGYIGERIAARKEGEAS